MAKITYHVHFDDATYKATVTTTPPKPQFNLGDKISFKSNKPGTAIMYKTSPFKELADGVPVNVPTGPYTLANRRRHHFDCGTLVQDPNPKPNPNPNLPNRNLKVSPPQFVAWKGGGNTPTKP
jgi:hypothetical protein